MWAKYSEAKTRRRSISSQNVAPPILSSAQLAALPRRPQTAGRRRTGEGCISGGVAVPTRVRQWHCALGLPRDVSPRPPPPVSPGPVRQVVRLRASARNNERWWIPRKCRISCIGCLLFPSCSICSRSMTLISFFPPLSVHAGEWHGDPNPSRSVSACGWHRAARQFPSAQLLWNVYKLCTMYAWRPKAPAPVHPMNRLSLRLVTAHAWGINAFSPALPKIHFSCPRILRSPSLSFCLTSLLRCVKHLPGLISLAKDTPSLVFTYPFPDFLVGLRRPPAILPSLLSSHSQSGTHSYPTPYTTLGSANHPIRPS